MTATPAATPATMYGLRLFGIPTMLVGANLIYPASRSTKTSTTRCSSNAAHPRQRRRDGARPAAPPQALVAAARADPSR